MSEFPAMLFPKVVCDDCPFTAVSQINPELNANRNPRENAKILATSLFFKDISHTKNKGELDIH